MDQPVQTTTAEEIPPASIDSTDGSTGAGTGASGAIAPRNVHGQFLILRSHARGGLGLVSVALDRNIGRRVALKTIRPDLAENPATRRRFVAEAEVTGQLEHPGIVPLYALGQDEDGSPYYAMKFIDGQTLEHAIASYHALPSPIRFRELLNRFIDVCHAVAYAHSQGVIHRDLKPANVMAGKYGETLILDWGLAKRINDVAETPDGSAGSTRADPPLLSSAPSASGAPPAASIAGLTTLGHAIGTPAYMSPEQARGLRAALEPTTDVYSLGAILYQLLTGHAPYSGPGAEPGAKPEKVLSQLLAGPPPPPRAVRPTIPRALEAICLRAMSREPRDRYATAELLVREIERWQADEPVEAYREPPAARAWRWARRHKVFSASLLSLLLTAVLALSVGITLVAREKRRAEVALTDEARQRSRAEDREAESRRHVYAAHMNLAQQAVDARQLGTALELLRQHRPAPGEEDLRGFDWYHLNWACGAGKAVTLTGTAGPITSLAFAPDGQSLFAAGEKGSVDQWMLPASASAAPARSIAGRGAVRALAMSPDGAEAAVVRDERVELFAASPAGLGETLRELNVGSMSSAVAFSPDGSTMAIVHGAAVELRDRQGASARRFFEEHAVRAVAFSPDGRTFASVGHDRQVNLRDVATGSLLVALHRDRDYTMRVAYSPSGKRLAVGTGRGEVLVFDDLTTPNQPGTVVHTHVGAVLGVAFTPDGQIVASGGEDGVLCVHNLANGSERLFGHEGKITALAVAPAGRSIATGSSRGNVKLWDITVAPEPTEIAARQGALYGLSWSPDGRTLASAAGDGTVKLWDISSARELATLRTGLGWALCVSYFPDGKHLVIGGQYGDVELWDAQSQQRLATFGVQQSAIWNIAPLSDGRTVACGGYMDCDVKMLDVTAMPATKPAARSLADRLPERVFGLAVSPDESLLAAGAAVESDSEEGLGIWDLRRQKLLYRIKCGWPYALAFAPDGRTLASGSAGGAVRVWDVRTGAELHELSGHATDVRSVAFSPDGRIIASGSDDGTIKLWDTKTGEARARLGMHADHISAVRFSPDGKTLASADWAGVIRIWRTAIDADRP